ncbi:MAG TPA: AAA family ATPase, partial [Arthrobacter sp.]|nr:AAA family ATPase [Arthrobacter sp.]
RGFYDGGLRRLPEGQSATGLDRALTVEYLPDGTGLPSADQDGVESVVAEVNRAVELVFEHARLRPRTSLAVVTGSLRHAARIGESIRLQLPNYPLLASFFSAGDESFRVVDLERAQGLVRDHVIFSPGYGRTPHGRALHSLGPLSAEGGRAKFALAMTRARRSLHVLSCFRPEDLDVSRLSHGAVDFYELLDREIAGNSDLGSPASRAAASEQALGADPLVADLGDRLRARGARVWHQYDGVLNMVAAADPLSTLGHDDAEIPRPVAIESDGTEQYRRMSVRERSRLRPQLLERLGWRYMPLWTIEVFTDPSACADRIGGYLRLEKPSASSRMRNSTGFFDDDVANLAVIDAQVSDARAFSQQAPPAQASHGWPDTVHQQATSGSTTGSEETGGMSADGDIQDNSGEDNSGRRSAGEHREVENPAREQDAPAENPPAEDAPAEDAPAEDAPRATAAHAAVPAAVLPNAVLPNKAAEDDPRRWGDQPSGYDHDAWLQEQKPPHWG